MEFIFSKVNSRHVFCKDFDYNCIRFPDSFWFFQRHKLYEMLQQRKNGITPKRNKIYLTGQKKLSKIPIILAEKELCN